MARLSTDRLAAQLLEEDTFEIRDRLGEGGMGVVYRAYDRQRQSEVALKTLPHLDDTAAYRLKKEFRSLADVTHKNLVTLHELVVDAQKCFFTMELVIGVSFTDYVYGQDAEVEEPEANSAVQRQGGEPSELNRFVTLPEAARPGSIADPERALRRAESTVVERSAAGAATQASEALQQSLVAGDPTFLRHAVVAATGIAQTRRSEPKSSQVPAPGRSLAATRPCDIDLPRLHAVLAQLTDAVHALHSAGKLHLDLKPSNVFVQPNGRVVVLDFGLARSHHGAETDPVDQGAIAGTPAYMAPEQAAGDRLSPAADYYAIGAMIYHVLTGAVPFADRGPAILVAKQVMDPVPPSHLASDVPADLEQLCMHLLAREPEERAGRAEIAAYLGDEPWHEPASEKLELVGRGDELQSLWDALRRTREGKPNVVVVRGEAGMGKSTLVHRFLSDVGVDGRVVVLAGRCYERESLPFKAFDSAMDALVHHLMRLPRSEAAALLPRGAHALARLFPVLKQIKALSDVPQGLRDASNIREIRARAFGALKELLRSLCDRSPVILFIDDGHWGDGDSAQLLLELLGPPEPPSLLLLITHRTDVKGPFLAEGIDQLAAMPHLALRKIDVGPLSQRDAHILAAGLMGDADPARIAKIATEAEGSPLFLAELARRAATSDRSPVSGLDLAAVLKARIEQLDTPARRLLETVALAGGPVEQGVVARAAAIDGDSQAVFATLRGLHLIRTHGSRERDHVESYHDRIREVTSRIVPKKDAVGLHRALARELEATQRADPEQLVQHWEHAGEPRKAGELAVIAARQAAKAFAFEHAAELFRKALSLGAPAPDLRRELFRELAVALQNAGRGGEAARAFLSAAEGADAEETFDLERQAMEQFLVCGHTSEGLTVMKRVLEAVDLPYVESPAVVLPTLLYRRAKLKIRGLSFRERPAHTIPGRTLRQLDTCFSVALGFSALDPLNAASYQALHLSRALDAGDARRVAQGLILEGGHQATLGAEGAPRAGVLLRRAEELNRRLGDPYLTAFGGAMSGVREFAEGRWRSCVEACDNATSLFQEKCSGAIWEVDTAQLFALFGLAACGDYASIRRRLPEWIKDADARGDVYASTSFRVFWAAKTMVSLADDEPERASAEIGEALRRWSRKRFYVQFFYALWSETLIDLYQGRGREAHERIQGIWRKLEWSLLLKMQPVRMQAYALRAWSALAHAPGSSRPSLLLRNAAKDAQRIAGEKVAWGAPQADFILAEIAAQSGDQAGRRRKLTDAVEGFHRTDLQLHAAVARRKLARLIGGAEGESLERRARDYFDAQGVRDQARFERAIAPGIDM